MTTFEIITIALTILGMAVAIFRWVARMDANTAATEKLTRAFELFADKIEERLLDHERRISRLEGHGD